MQQTLSGDVIAHIRAALLGFFDEAARPLPWRFTRDPYAIWISEVMAQQTRVETVVPYYERWLARFPDVNALAASSIDDVLKAWEGLGYYSRARNLHAAARVVHERHDAALPGDYDTLRELPGIGEYTAGAIASIAFDAPRPAIDGNVRRVLARVLDHPDPPATLLRATATALVPHDRPGDFNQALMELGATLCTPRTPHCGRCPIARSCAARAAGTQMDRPRSRPARAGPVIDIVTAVLRDGDGRLLITRRPERGLLGGLWSFPGDEVAAPVRAASRARVIARRFGTPASRARPLGTVEHAFSHRRERYHCYAIEISAVKTPAECEAWIAEGDDSRALPRAQQRIRRLALAHVRSSR